MELTEVSFCRGQKILFTTTSLSLLTLLPSCTMSLVSAPWLGGGWVVDSRTLQRL